jgi:hypothetical protein
MPKRPKQGEPETALIPIERIEQRIYVIRGHKVMLDRDLAELYQVKAIALRQQVKRNRSRFPDDFTFQLTTSEAENLVSQSVIASKRSLGGSLPYAFTEQGVAMLSAVLNSDRAVQVSIAIVRAFVKLREMLATNTDLAHKIDALERKYADHNRDIQVIFKAIKKLLEPPPEPPKKRIGFVVDDTGEGE